MTELLGLDPRTAYTLTVADRLCEAVAARHLTRDEATDVLLRLFPTPAL